MESTDLIPAKQAITLPGLFFERCRRSPEREAYRQFERESGQWRSLTWSDMHSLVRRWQSALRREQLEAGDRVAILAPNSVSWVCMDIAAQSLGLVVVPLYTTDNPESIGYILADAGASLLLVQNIEQWNALRSQRSNLPALRRVVCVERPDYGGAAAEIAPAFLDDWLPPQAIEPVAAKADPASLATIMYTSGTTGRPKGVMLSHRNILANAEAVLRVVPAYPADVFLSFLPLSHAFERTAGYYVPMMAGCTVAYARSVQNLAEDLATVRPTVLISVPRIYERVYARLQHGLAEKGRLAQLLFGWAQAVGWRRFEARQRRDPVPLAARLAWPALRRLVAGKLLARLGGRVRVAVTGGAPLNPKIARCFLGLGLPVLEGYGLTEAAPTVAANTAEDNLPGAVGRALPGVELKLGDNDELLVRGPNVMLGYWNNPRASAEAIPPDGWLRTGDVARIEDGRVFIVGRLKEILVTSTGEKVPPADVEMAITEEALFDQAMVIGEGKPFLAALLVLNPDAWRAFAREAAVDPDDPGSLASTVVVERALQRVSAALHAFPRHAQVRRARLVLEPWTIDNGLLTPTMKPKRRSLESRFAREIEVLFAGHAIPA